MTTPTLLGYADRLSVAPGEMVRFMVSAEVPRYEARLVRLVQGDESPAGPGYREEAVGSAIDGFHSGYRQVSLAGSFIQVEHHPALDVQAGLTVQAWIYPTTPARAARQGICTRWSPTDGAGFGLGLEDGFLTFWLGIGSGYPASTVVRADRPLRASTWYFVAVTYDAASGRVRLYHQPLRATPPDTMRLAVDEAHVEPSSLGGKREPLLMAATHLEPANGGRQAPRGLYNGKIDRPSIFGRALDDSEISALRDGVPPQSVAPEALVAAWDFATDFGSSHVHDTSPHCLHGAAVNMPTRAVTGHNWSGRELSWLHARSEYGAIHFHDDDLEDAGWEPSLELTIPEGTRSGIYAARLTAGDAEEYIPFYVRPKPGSAGAPIAFLAPTLTYIAYANERMYWKDSYRANRHKLTTTLLEPPERDIFLAEHRELGLSTYDAHADGSGVCYSSRQRPILNMRPKYRWWRLHDAPRHFSADLYLTGWLEAAGHAYDVITDEDLHHEGIALLEPYRAVITGSHPEYTTDAMWTALDQYLGAGGRLMYLGGNGFYWVTSIDPGRPHVLEVRRGTTGTRAWESAPGEVHHSTTGEPGGLWRLRGRAPQTLVGVGFAAQGWGGAAGYLRQPGSFDPRAAFIFEGIGQEELIGDFGLILGGAAGDEIDRFDEALGTPPHALVLATSAGRHTDYYQVTVEDISITLPGQGGTENPKVRADMVYFETPNGGAVFSVGSINWLGSLAYSRYENNVARVTENVLRKFLEP